MALMTPAPMRITSTSRSFGGAPPQMPARHPGALLTLLDFLITCQISTENTRPGGFLGFATRIELPLKAPPSLGSNLEAQMRNQGTR